MAASRNESVMGRTRILIVSIITKKGFNQSGAPPGKSPPENFIGLKNNLERIIVIHSESPKISVKIKCLVTLNL